MNAETAARLIEEMMDLKLQHYAESQMRPSPEVAGVLRQKAETDRRRLEQIRSELARLLHGGPAPAFPDPFLPASCTFAAERTSVFSPRLPIARSVLDGETPKPQIKPQL